MNLNDLYLQRDLFRARRKKLEAELEQLASEETKNRGGSQLLPVTRVTGLRETGIDVRRW